ncbi:hypothetical protein [Mesorhizobium sp. WSM2239]|uniref:M23 family peptidase n=2 Tax=unclassified Mesorhizobium TaxID=325217 RepID=A0AAU8D964_9HYPH
MLAKHRAGRENALQRLTAGLDPGTMGAMPGRRSALFGGFVGAGLAVLAAAALWFAEGAWSSVPSQTERQRQFEAQVEKSLPSIDIAVQFLERVEQEVSARMLTERHLPPGLTKGL